MNRYFNKTAAKQVKRISRKCRRLEQSRAKQRAREAQELLERNKEWLLHAQGKPEYRRGY